MPGELTNLANAREAILLAEIGALLHDIGKLSAEFVQSVASDRSWSAFRHEEALDQLPDLHCLRGVLGQLPGAADWNTLKVNLSAQPKLSDFVKRHHPNDGGGGQLLALLRTCDHRDSGADKGTLPKDRGKQPMAETAVASAFGRESALVEVSQLAKVRSGLASKLVERLGTVAYSAKKASEIRSAILDVVREAFRQGLGETRRGANDVTLWDHSYSVASLFKAGLANACVQGQMPAVNKGRATCVAWRVLWIGTDGIGFLAQAHRIGDILGRRKAFEDALNRVRELLEVRYPLGNEVYRDENGSAFVVPDDLSLLQWTDDGTRKPLAALIQDAFSQETMADEVDLVLEDTNRCLSDRSRAALHLGRLLARPAPPLRPRSERILVDWHQEAAQKREICTTCGLRPRNSSDDEARPRGLCGVCLDRRVGRSRQWLESPHGAREATIWIGEVADRNGKAAMIVGRLGLDDWLRGDCLESMLVQALPPDGPSCRVGEAAYGRLKCQVEEALSKNVEARKGSILDEVAPEAFKAGTDAKTFYDEIVDGKDVRGIGLSLTDLGDRAHLLSFLLLKKHPSPARLRRIWETAYRFWDDVTTRTIPCAVGERCGRLRLSIKDDLSKNLRKGYAYDLAAGDARFSAVWDGGSFIVVENLAWLANAHFGREQDASENAAKCVADRLNEQEIRIYRPTGYGRPDQPLGSTQVREAEPWDHHYLPYTSLLSAPRTLMALVPGADALDVVRGIRQKYEDEMGKVRNRLPLALGVVFFDRHTPLYAVLDAGRQMLEMPLRPTTWQIDELEQAQGDGTVRVTFVRRTTPGAPVAYKVPVTVWDGAADLHHPYFYVKTFRSQAGPETRSHCIQSYLPEAYSGNSAPESAWIVHATELQKEDCVWVTPSYFDFIYLDATTRRFEVVYGDNQPKERMHRPYLLEELDELQWVWDRLSHGQDGLTNTQINGLHGLIEAKRAEWSVDALPAGDARRGVFDEFVKQVLLNADWGRRRPTGADLERLCQAARCRLLSDVVELHMSILEENSKRGNEQLS
jgi:hypothetical protein